MRAYPVIGIIAGFFNPCAILPQEDKGYIVTDKKVFVFNRELERLPEGEDVVELSIIVDKKEIYFVIEFSDQNKIENMYVKSFLENCGHRMDL